MGPVLLVLLELLLLLALVIVHVVLKESERTRSASSRDAPEGSSSTRRIWGPPTPPKDAGALPRPFVHEQGSATSKTNVGPPLKATDIKRLLRVL